MDCNETQKCCCNDYSIGTMIKDFYNKKNSSIIIFVWIYSLALLYLAFFYGAKFLDTNETKSQIFYASLFLVMIQLMILIKIFAWQIIHRNNIKRQLAKIEEKIDKLSAN